MKGKKVSYFDDLEFDITLVDYVKRGDWQCHQWEAEITRTSTNETMTIDYFTGMAITEDPSLEDVLYAMVSDKNTIDGANSFEDWCYQYGYNSDSITDHDTYLSCVKHDEMLRQFFGLELTIVAGVVERMFD